MLKQDSHTPASWLIDVLIAIVCGLAFWWLAFEKLGRAHMLDPWNTADMSDYCNGILHLLGEPDVPWSIKRSKITGWVATPLATEQGIMSALRTSSAVATTMVGGGLYLWGRVAGGRTAGILAALAGLALSPLVLLPRILTFYPMVSAFFVLGAVGVTAGIVYRSPRSLFWAGAGIGLALLGDVRGLVWAVPWMFGAVIAVAYSTHKKRALKWLLAPLAVSFLIGHWSYTKDAVNFEAQLDVRPLWKMYGSKDPAHQPPYDTGGSFVWGHSGPWKLPQTGLFIINQMRLTPPKGFPPQVSRFGVDNHLAPMKPVWLGAGLLAILALIGRPRAFLAVGVTVLPFAIAFHGQQNMAEIRVRFLCQIMPALALLIGVSLGKIVDGIPGPWRQWKGGSHPIRTFVAGGTLFAIVTGEISTPASPWASWRRPWPVVSELLVMHPDSEIYGELGDRKKPCARALKRDQDAGKWLAPLRRRVKVRDVEDPADPTRR
ncbi:MAG: hypothetical protein CL930_12970 [Deltaproteobacteria bacterium]|nr:hypothetical protein [Deltaproteobacteria bacterium]